MRQFQRQTADRELYARKLFAQLQHIGSIHSAVAVHIRIGKIDRRRVARQMLADREYIRYIDHSVIIRIADDDLRLNIAQPGTCSSLSAA